MPEDGPEALAGRQDETRANELSSRGIRAGRAIDWVRSMSTTSMHGGRHLGFVAVIEDTFHAETTDGQLLGAFPTNEEAAAALLNATKR